MNSTDLQITTPDSNSVRNITLCTNDLRCTTLASNVLFTTLNGLEVTTGFLLVNLFILLTGILALVLNGLVLDTLVRQPNIEASHLIICHLTVTDMCSGCFIILSFCYNIGNYHVVGECIIRLGSMVTFMASSVLHLLLHTIDRYVKINYPFKYINSFTNKNASIFSSVIWVASTLLGLLPAFGWRNTPEPTQNPCEFSIIMTKGYIITILLTTALPLIVITPIYMALFRVSYRHSMVIHPRRTAWMPNAEPQSLQFAKTVSVIFLAYVVAWFPFGIAMLLFLCGQLDDMSHEDIGDVIIFCSALLFINPVVNPVIYGFKLPPVRRRIRVFYSRIRALPPPDSSIPNI